MPAQSRTVLRRPFPVRPFLSIYTTDELANFMRSNLDDPFSAQFAQFITLTKMTGANFVHLSDDHLRGLCPNDDAQYLDLKNFQRMLKPPSIPDLRTILPRLESLPSPPPYEIGESDDEDQELDQEELFSTPISQSPASSIQEEEETAEDPEAYSDDWSDGTSHSTDHIVPESNSTANWWTDDTELPFHRPSEYFIDPLTPPSPSSPRTASTPAMHGTSLDRGTPLIPDTGDLPHDSSFPEPNFVPEDNTGAPQTSSSVAGLVDTADADSAAAPSNPPIETPPVSNETTHALAEGEEPERDLLKTPSDIAETFSLTESEDSDDMTPSPDPMATDGPATPPAFGLQSPLIPIEPIPHSAESSGTTNNRGVDANGHSYEPADPPEEPSDPYPNMIGAFPEEQAHHADVNEDNLAGLPFGTLSNSDVAAEYDTHIPQATEGVPQLPLQETTAPAPAPAPAAFPGSPDIGPDNDISGLSGVIGDLRTFDSGDAGIYPSPRFYPPPFDRALSEVFMNSDTITNGCLGLTISPDLRMIQTPVSSTFDLARIASPSQLEYIYADALEEQQQEHRLDGDDDDMKPRILLSGAHLLDGDMRRPKIEITIPQASMLDDTRILSMLSSSCPSSSTPPNWYPSVVESPSQSVGNAARRDRSRRMSLSRLSLDAGIGSRRRYLPSPHMSTVGNDKGKRRAENDHDHDDHDHDDHHEQEARTERGGASSKKPEPQLTTAGGEQSEEVPATPIAIVTEPPPGDSSNNSNTAAGTSASTSTSTLQTAAQKQHQRSPVIEFLGQWLPLPAWLTPVDSKATTHLEEEEDDEEGDAVLPIRMS